MTSDGGPESASASIQSNPAVVVDRSWQHDVVIENEVSRSNYLTTTGGIVWQAARTLCEYLEEEGQVIGLNSGRDEIHVLELGAGCGFLGMTVARNLPQVRLGLLQHC